MSRYNQQQSYGQEQEGFAPQDSAMGGPQGYNQDPAQDDQFNQGQGPSQDGQFDGQGQDRSQYENGDDQNQDPSQADQDPSSENANSYQDGAQDLSQFHQNNKLGAQGNSQGADNDDGSDRFAGQLNSIDPKVGGGPWNNYKQRTGNQQQLQQSGAPSQGAAYGSAQPRGQPGINRSAPGNSFNNKQQQQQQPLSKMPPQSQNRSSAFAGNKRQLQPQQPQAGSYGDSSVRPNAAVGQVTGYDKHHHNALYSMSQSAAQGFTRDHMNSFIHIASYALGSLANTHGLAPNQPHPEENQ